MFVGLPGEIIQCWTRLYHSWSRWLLATLCMGAGAEWNDGSRNWSRVHVGTAPPLSALRRRRILLNHSVVCCTCLEKFPGLFRRTESLHGHRTKLRCELDIQIGYSFGLNLSPNWYSSCMCFASQWSNGPLTEFRPVLKIVVPDELHGSIITKSLPVRPNMTTREVCKIIAHKARITNPQDYGLFKLVDGEGNFYESHLL